MLNETRGMDAQKPQLIISSPNFMDHCLWMRWSERPMASTHFIFFVSYLPVRDSFQVTRWNGEPFIAAYFSGEPLLADVD